MIYILTGIAKSGKSLVAKEMKNRFNISVISTDYLMMMVHYASDLKLDIEASDTTVAKNIEPYTYGLIKTLVENDEDMIFEGVHFRTEFSERLLREFHVNIRILYMGYREVSVEDKVKELKKHRRNMKNPWLFKHKGKKIDDIVSYMIEESNRLFDECFHHSLLYYDVNDINKQMDEIIELLMD